MKKTVFFCTITLIAASIQSIHASLTMLENEEQFNKIINADTPSMVIFSAEWCGGCKSLKEPLQKIADNSEFVHITFLKVDVDKFDALSKKYHVRYLPTIYFMKNGQTKHEIIGAKSEKELRDTIQKVFNAQDGKKEELREALHDAALDAKQALKETSQDIKETAHKVEDAIAETHKEATTTVPVESAGPFQMVWNIIASPFIYIKDLIVNLFNSIVSFLKNIF